MTNDKLIPYNTGKVQIGLQYVAPDTNYMDHEAEHWQNVLTGVHQSRRRTRSQFVVYVVALVIIFSVLGMTL
jgi:hypothetical protein